MHSNGPAFNLIWNRLPELQNRHSSVWWFFLLFPKQAEGFGPKQMMFVIVSKVGRSVTINGRRFTGLEHPPPAAAFESPETISAIVLGWIYDGQHMREGIVLHDTEATLSRDGALTAWSPGNNGQSLGGELLAADGSPFGVAARFNGTKGSARFDVWGDPSSAVGSPANSVDINTPFGGSQVIAWRRLFFEGDFAHQGGNEHLSGIGYFQRICLNFNPFPWKWIWCAFADQSVFSGFVPYVGPQLFRRGDWFFPAPLETATVSIRPTAYFNWADSKELVTFDQTRFTPVFDRSKIAPDFLVDCRSANGDFLRYRAASYSQAQVLLDERAYKVLPRRLNYNEYLFRVSDLKGRVAGRAVNQQTVGQGFGNCEYTWGLGA